MSGFNSTFWWIKSSVNARYFFGIRKSTIWFLFYYISDHPAVLFVRLLVLHFPWYFCENNNLFYCKWNLQSAVGSTSGGLMADGLVVHVGVGVWPIGLTVAVRCPANALHFTSFVLINNDNLLSFRFRWATVERRVVSVCVCMCVACGSHSSFFGMSI